MQRGNNSIRYFIFLIFGLLLFVPITATTQIVDIESLASQVSAEIKRMMLEGNVPSATVAIVHEDKTIWTCSLGYSNIWAQIPAIPQTVYLIGSTFKTMSTFALLQQMEKGKFKLDDGVNNYLTEFKIQGDNSSNPVTFRHLLTHTAGLPSDFGGHAVWGDTVPLSLEDYLGNSLKLANPVMTKLEYSNMAYTLVAYLVEKFSGVPYKKYIRENIFKPLEMDSTDFYPRSDMEEKLAIPYVIDKNGKHIPAMRVKANVWPAGIVYGTIMDQANWLIANLNEGVYKGHRLISKNSFSQAMTRQFDEFKGPIAGRWLNDTTGYGLTWWMSKRNGDTLFAHSGSVSGYTAFIVGNLEKKIGFAVLTNGNRAHRHLYKLAVSVLDIMESCMK